MRLNDFLRYCGWATVLAAAAEVFIHICITPLLADDMYYGVFAPSKGGLRHAVAGVWWHTNARSGDLTNYIWIYMLPRIVTAALCAGMMILLFLSLACLGGASPRRRPALWCVSVAAASLLLPWWDAFPLIVVHLNYVWAIALAGLSLWLVTSREMKSNLWILFAPVALISGFGHEITGMPLCSGIVAWLSWGRHGKLSRAKWIVIAALIVGSFISVSSPGCYSRLNNPLPSVTTDRSIIEIVVISGFMGLAVMADALVMLLFRRRLLVRLCRTLWLPLAVVSVSSMAFIIVSHTMGRTGWATQFFGFAALLYRLSASAASLGKWRWSASLPALILAAQWLFACYWQVKVDREAAANLELFFANPGQEISGHFTRCEDIPVVLMRKVEPDQLAYPWPRQVVEMTYGAPPKIPAYALIEE